ncbi:tetratricopeptide repeat protein [uncultured Cetobacterium sp.]|uniref:tetratricopeptide repeat protein n=1 Tax=uncultured Cetobacterium sp. TaxID=527638 RepID=UPI00261BBB97|nr:tetratricopeptide repeat protein [uncultured Cetobacterium sp.]
MKKIKLLIAGFLICSGLFASEKEDIKFLDELFIQKKYSMALQESNTFLNKYPRSKYLKNIKIRMGQVYYVEGRYQEAINTFNACLKELKLKKEESNNIYLYLTKSYVGLKDFTTASKAANLIDKVSPEGKNDYEEALLSIGKGYMENKDYIRAQKELSTALTLQGKNYEDVVLNLALAAYNNSQYIKTIVYLDEYYRGAKVGVNKNLVNYLYGSSYYKTNENSKALNYFMKVKSSNEDSEYKTLSVLTMIEIYLKQGNSKEAEAILSSLSSDQKLNDVALKSFGDFYLVRGLNDMALKYYNRIQNKNVDVLYGIALSQYRLKDYKTSLENFRRLYTTKYKNESIYYQMSIEYLNKNYKWVLGNRNLAAGLNLSKEEELAINNLIGTSAFEEGDFKIAESFYEKNYNLNPNKETLYKLIVALSKLKNKDRLMTLINEFNSKYPTDQEYKKNITILMADNFINDARGEEAITIYKNYLLTDRDSNIVSNLIDVMIAQKQYNEVMQYLNIQDASSENTYLKGIATMGMGRYDEAEVYFNQVSSIDTQVPKALQEKAKYNALKNYFLWEKYSDVINSGEEYIAGDNLYALEDVVDKVAISYFRIDNPEKAREYFEKLKLVSNMGDYAQFQIGETYYSEKRYPQAIEAYRISAVESKNSEYREKGSYWEISSLYLMKNLNEFELKSKEFVKNYPNSKLKDNIILMEGELYGLEGKTGNSLSSYKRLYNETKDEALKEKSLIKILDIAQNSKNFENEMDWINKITNDDKKTYYLAKHLNRQNKTEEYKVQLEKLMTTSDYKDFAALGLGDYYFDKKDYIKANENYNLVLGLENSGYKDRALYQVANIQKENGAAKDAIRNYTKLYVLYPTSEYALESKIRSAEGYESLGEYKEAITQYDELLKTESKNKPYFLEKLIFLNLKIDKNEIAKKYYEELKKENKNLSEKYKDFFNGGENL